MIEQAYSLVLSLALVAALWLNVRALPHVVTLAVWWAASVWLDQHQASEMKLFTDFFGFYAILYWTIRNAIKFQFAPMAERLCAWLAASQVAFNTIMWGGSYFVGRFNLSQEVFSGYQTAYGWGGSLLFLGSVIALLWGAKVRDRVVDFAHSAHRLRLRLAGVFAAPKAYGQSIKRIGVLDGGVRIGGDRGANHAERTPRGICAR